MTDARTIISFCPLSQLVTRSSASESVFWSPKAAGVATKQAQVESNGVHVPNLVTRSEVGSR